jgi:CHASE2 domain-containing sensor protein
MKKLKTLLIILIAFKAVVFCVGYAYEKKYFQLFNINELATEDIQLNDIYYNINNGDTAVEIKKDIVLINTGSIAKDGDFRRKLFSLIEQVVEYKPKRIGVDIFFENAKDSFSDSLLKETILNNDIVTAFDFQQKHINIFENKSKGLVNFPSKLNETIRQYYNYVTIGNDTIPSFAAALTNIHPKNSIDYLNYCSEYNGYYNFLDDEAEINPNNFPAIEASAFLDDANSIKISELLKGKIVILGHLGTNNMNNSFDVEDKFKVPTDSMLFNRLPIMPGAVIHANAAQMLLKNDLIRIIDGWQFEIISALILFIYLYLFYTIKQKSKYKKLINVVIILLTTFVFILISCVYMMNIGIFIAVGGLCAQIALIEGFVEIEEEFLNIIGKYKKDENK